MNVNFDKHGKEKKPSTSPFEPKFKTPQKGEDSKINNLLMEKHGKEKKKGDMSEISCSKCKGVVQYQKYCPTSRVANTREINVRMGKHTTMIGNFEDEKSKGEYMENEKEEEECNDLPLLRLDYKYLIPKETSVMPNTE